MNSGLPSLLDAIFGKQDLASVSLDEMYDVISEFPSFNAAHFLLARKLKQQQDAAYEKEAMRTALYFNNPFWLQSLLDNGNQIKQPQSDFLQPSMPVTYDQEVLPPEDTAADELDEETAEILEEKTESENNYAEDSIQYSEPGPETVTSFDELMSKYNLEPVTEAEELPVENQPESEEVYVPDAEVESIQETVSVFAPEPLIAERPAEPVSEDFISSVDVTDIQTFSAPIVEHPETSEEIVNEYGIFEQLIVKKTNQDHDLDAFDRPEEFDPPDEQNIPEEFNSESVRVAENSFAADTAPIAEFIPAVNDVPAVENEAPEDSPDKTDEHDYDSFDRPEEEPDLAIPEAPATIETYESGVLHDADDTDAPAIVANESVDGQPDQMKNLSDRFEEQQKSLAAFHAKNADSIVFTPYHMVDYFASQGIKLVLDENPPDQFGKQLKSFTDWLKVMKKIPVQQNAEKTEEKEVERVRHFADHSIQERDVLTESMAEVLAKQGMLDNAIALYRKLSLIYPPKSAYFASRIEQLKAFLP